MAGYRENRKFASDVFDNLLGDVIDWIKSNLSPSEVFDESDLKDLAQDNGYIKEED